MHDLAPLKFAMSSASDWLNARLPATFLTGYSMVQLKTLPASEGELVASYSLPTALATAAVGHVEVLWVGPGEWLMIASPEHRSELVQLEQRLNGSGVASARCGSRLCMLEFRGGTAVLVGLTGLPDVAIAPGRVARTRLADVPVVLAMNGDSAVRMIFDRAYAPHLRAWLDRATC